MRIVSIFAVTVVSACILVSCCQDRSRTPLDDRDELVGAWRASVQFSDGAFAGIHDLEFMYVFNAGGTMTESSNYDAAPPVPPAYGAWKKIGDRTYLATYEFFMTRPPDSTEGSTASTGWLPAGWGVLVDTIVVAEDGKSFQSRIRYSALDRSGRAVESGGSAEGKGTRIGE